MINNDTVSVAAPGLRDNDDASLRCINRSALFRGEINTCMRMLLARYWVDSGPEVRGYPIRAPDWHAKLASSIRIGNPI
ncbi:hypothetical protein D3C71_1934200 [compost metagenome]